MRSWLTGNILTGLVLGLSASALCLGLDGAAKPAFAGGKDDAASPAATAEPAAISTQLAAGGESQIDAASDSNDAAKRTARLKAWVERNRPIWQARRQAQAAAETETATSADSGATAAASADQPTTGMALIPVTGNDIASPAESVASQMPTSPSPDPEQAAGPVASPASPALPVAETSEDRQKADHETAAARLAAAQLAAATPPTPQGGTPGKQAQNDLPVNLIADEAGYDEELGVYVARGHVQIRRGDKIALADTVAYNERTKRITASGNVAVLEPTGDTMFGDYVDISDDFSNGAFEGFRALMADKSRLAANKATKIDDTHMQLDKAVYTPCLPCKEDPTRVPLWQIKARKVERDEEAQTLTYHDAWMEMWGVPVFYTPWFRHPDIGVDRQSGLLTPGMSYSSKGGFQYRQSYFQTIGPDKDITLTPIFRYGGKPEEDPGAVGMLQYRQRIEDGKFSLGGSMTVEDRPADSDESKTIKRDFRGHIEGEGQFDLNDDWRAGFNFKNTTDKDYLRHYHLGSSRWLQDQMFAEGFFGRSYASAEAFAFQSTKRNLKSSDAPFVTPKLDYNFLSEPGWMDSTWALDFDTMNIVRRDDKTGQFRMALSPSFTLPYTSPLGDIYKLTLSLEGALYGVNDVNPNDDDPFASDSSFSGWRGRLVPKADLTWRYPFVRPGETFSQVIEPMIQFVGAPTWGNSSKISNEDSRFFDLDDTRLFSADRFVGLDRYDTGSRATYGLNWSGYLNSGGQANAFLGQSYQFTKGDRDQDLSGTGIDEDLTDVVGRLAVIPNQYLDLSYRFRLNVSEPKLKRQEALVGMGPNVLHLNLSYIQLDKSQDIDLEIDNNDNNSNSREFVGAYLSSQFAQYWTLGVSSVYDIEQTEITQVGGLLKYLDECFGLSLAAYYQPGGGSEDSDSSFTTFFSITFKNIGSLKSGT
ncbi:LPS assembly protein LptD [Dongia soli]|uniref:LPS-assembly protein LptD n=1 Tax=Dongia soli TaxID=600628 RepID=A0ABU5ECY8_9PROT|nr:LPS assembly protein LptD [Dongia soli]MDY0884022.1 LPS assembly protein LptD [Dongia soli]